MRAIRSAGCGALATVMIGCSAVPPPLVPWHDGSVGRVNGGALLGGVELRPGQSILWHRQNERHWGSPRFVGALERAAAKVSKERGGAPLVVGDLSARFGGHLAGHASHRSGRDADILFYVTTPLGASIRNPGFCSFGADGLAPATGFSGGYLRFDVSRQWRFVKALLEDVDARIQWIFISAPLRAYLLNYAFAKREPLEVQYRAAMVLHQPGRPALPHDDHIHVRTECAPSELATGCQPTGPWREWFGEIPAADVTVADVD
jgi:penicillin-insensitive murein endopeptidase